MKRIDNRTRIISLVKLLLWVAGAIMVASLLIIPLFNKDNTAKSIAIEKIYSDGLKQNLVDARFHGIDEHNRPYSIASDLAEQQDENNVFLRNIYAELNFDNQDWSSLSADRGWVEMKLRRLYMQGNIIIYTTYGYEAFTERAVYDMQTAQIYSDRNIRMRGALGKLTAGNFKLYHEEQRMEFSGGVRLVIEPSQFPENRD